MKKKLLASCVLLATAFSLNAQSNSWGVYNTSNSGIPSNVTNWINKTSNGDIYISTDAGLAKFDGTNWTTYNTSNSGITSNLVGRSRIDPSGNIWMFCNGVTKFDGASFTNYNSSNSTLPAFNYTNFDVDSNGVVWLVSANGLVKFDGVNSTVYDSLNSPLPTNLLTTIIVDPNNIVWTGKNTGGGLFKFDGTTWTNYSTTNSGNTSNSIVQLLTIGNTKWFINPSSFTSLVSFDDTNWQSFPFSTSVIATVANMSPDDAGNIWMPGVSPNGPAIARFNGSVFSTFSSGFKIKTSRVRNNILFAASSDSSGVHYLDLNHTCALGSASATLDINNVNAAVDNGGGLWNGNLPNPGQEFPKGDTTHNIFSGGIWILGQSESNQLKGAVNMFNQINDFYPGSLDHYSAGDTVDASDCFNFNRIWKLNKTTIDSFKLGLFSVTPQDILEWPAKGNPNLSFSINRELAPFVDVDKNYSYNPAAGDYPLIKGDQALWWVVNDGKGEHQSAIQPIGIEVQYMAYAYNANNALQNTTFYEVKITNKSDSILRHTNVTVFIDPDIGNYKDDFVGTDTLRNMGIAYNGDSFDETTTFSKGYGATPPLIGVNMLQGPKDEFREPVKIKNLFSFTNTSSWGGNPSAPNEYWLYMNSYWRDGVPLFYGGDGHGGGTGATTTPTNFMYPSNPSSASGWSECTAGDTPDDRRFMITYGEFNLVPGQTNSFTFSAVNVANAGGGCGITFQPLLDATDSVKKFFDTTLCKNFSVQLTNTVNTTCGNHTGKAEVFASGGTPPYFYDWTSGSITPVADSLSAGQYVINVTDVMGCNQFLSFNISDAEGPTVTASVTPSTCNGNNNGAINISVAGSNPPFKYIWSRGDTTQDISGLQAGPYEVSVTDASGCQTNLSITAAQPNPILITGNVTPSSCNNSVGSIDISVNGGNGTYTYQWSNGATTQDLSLLPANEYVVTVTDGFGCTGHAVFDVNDSNGPVVSLNQLTPANCSLLNSGAIDINVSSGNPGYNFIWSNFAITEDLLAIASGAYSVVVTDQSGCKGIFSETVNPLLPSGANICLVSVDTTSNTNIIGWSKAAAADIKQYNIYRESTTAGVYYLIDVVPYDSLSLYVDSTSNPNIKSWRYKISVTDTCGNESVLSYAQKTIHLSLSNAPGSVLLSWDHYEGFPFNEYHIYRWTGVSGWIALDTVPSNYTYYYDYTAPVMQTVAYSVEVLAPDTCFFTRTANNQNTSRSNKKTILANPSPTLGVNSYVAMHEESQARIYPNPNTGEFMLQMNSAETGNFVFQLLNMEGKIIVNDAFVSGKNSFTRPYSYADLPNGVYFGRLLSKNKIYSLKIVVSK